MSGGRPTVLYVNQTGQISGAERSLLDLIAATSPHVSPVVACPAGRLLDELQARGIPTRSVPGTDVSFRIHPLHTARGVAWVGRAGRRVRTLSRRLDAAIVHANTTRAGLAAALAARTGGRPTIVHVRDCVPPGSLARFTLRSVETGAAAVVANSAHVAGQIPGSDRNGLVRVIHNPVDVRRFDPDRLDREAARATVGIGEDDVVMAVIAQLTRWKGQAEAIRVLSRLKPAHGNLRLLIVGSAKFTAPSTRLDNRAYERELRRLVADQGLGREVRFLGERDDVPTILRAADLLLVPSWQEAFGRIAAEGMAMRLPVLATSVGGPSEIVRDGVDGRVLSPRDPGRWAEAADELVRHPGMRRRMGERGRERAIRDFSLERHAEKVLSMYGEVLDGR